MFPLLVPIAHTQGYKYWCDEKMLLPATTKLGQGNIFIGVCQEFCSQGGGGGLVPGGVVSNFSGGRGVSPIFQRVSNFSGGSPSFFFFFFSIFFPQKKSSGMHQTPPPQDGQCAAGTHPTGMHSCYLNFDLWRSNLWSMSYLDAGARAWAFVPASITYTHYLLFLFFGNDSPTDGETAVNLPWRDRNCSKFLYFPTFVYARDLEIRFRVNLRIHTDLVM